MADKVSFLDGFEKEPLWAANHGISRRTATRYRLHEGLPFLMWGNEVYIPLDKGREFILSRVRRQNPPRTRRERRPPERAAATA
jgi:hypothetical protein